MSCCLKDADDSHIVICAHQVIVHKGIKLNHVLELIIKNFFDLRQVHRAIRASWAVHCVDTEPTGWLNFVRIWRGKSQISSSSTFPLYQFSHVKVWSNKGPIFWLHECLILLIDRRCLLGLLPLPTALTSSAMPTETAARPCSAHGHLFRGHSSSAV